jgi:Tol biopolymer transport system component
MCLAGAAVACAEFIFGTPQRLSAAINLSTDNWEQSVASDDLSLYFASLRSGTWDLHVASRTSKTDPWSNVMSLGNDVNSFALEGSPDISSDGLTIFFNSDRAGGQGNRDIWMTTRLSLASQWDKPRNLGPVVNSNSFEGWPTITADGLSLYYSRGPNDSEGEIVVSQRASLADAWGQPVSLGVSGGTADISPDGLKLFFANTGPHGGIDIWAMTRANRNAPFGAPKVLPAPINTSGDDFSPNLSEDGRTFTFYSRGAIWQAAVVPEPSSYSLIVLAVLGLLWKWRS